MLFPLPFAYTFLVHKFLLLHISYRLVTTTIHPYLLHLFLSFFSTNMVDFGKSTMAVGPWGGQDGFRWDDGVYSGVRQLVIAHGAGIDSIRIEYDDRGFSVWSDKHGGSGGLRIDKVKLEYPDEFLTSIHGYYGSINEWGPEFVRSLTFESNKKTYGPYGIEDGTYFSFPMIGGKIIGFYGRGGWYLDAIGAYLEPFGLRPNLPKSLVQPRYAAIGTEKFGYSVVQGNLENNYDIVLAFRQKNEYNCQYPPYDLSRQTSSSQDFSDTESKDKMSSVHSFPSSIERVPSKPEKGNVSYGAWGGSGGTVFDDGVYMGVRQIHLSRNVGIVSIRVLYELNGEAIWGTKNGGTGGFKSDKIIFDYPYEILTRITGFYGPAMLMGPTVIKSLTFYTTKTKHGPFGEEQGQEFTTNAREGKIVGFHGRKDMFLDAIGVHVVEGKVMPPIRPPPNSSIQGEVVEGKPTWPICRPFNSSIQGEVVEGKPTPPIRPLFNSSIQGEVVEGKPILPIRPPFNSSIQGEGPATELDKPHWSNKLTLPWRGSSTGEDHNNLNLANRVVKEPAPCETGPWGGDGGRPWDDGVFSGIKQIYLTRKEAICSIQIEYDRNGQSVWSTKHGGDSGGTPIVIKLDHPHEVVTCISGFYGPTNGDSGAKVVKSLTFTTSRRKYGPYGEEIGRFFTSITTEGKVVGFHGRSSMYLDAIGVHMQHWLGNQKPSKSASLMKFFY